MKPLPTLSFCCCGCTLRLGVQIIGFAGLIVALPSAIKSLSGGEIPTDGLPPEAQPGISAVNDVLELLNIVKRLMAWSSVLFSSLLLYGVFYENHPAILSVVIVNVIEMTLLFLFGIFLAFATKAFWIIIIFILALLLPFYITWVEYSYAEELRIKKEGGEQHIQRV